MLWYRKGSRQCGLIPRRGFTSDTLWTASFGREGTCVFRISSLLLAR